MTFGSLTCPFCNAQLPIDSPRAIGVKTLCPRCQEPLPPALELANKSGLSVQEGISPTNPTGQGHGQPLADSVQEGLSLGDHSFPPKPRRANRVLGLYLVGGMAVVALVTLVFALRTTGARRANDFRGKFRPGTERIIQAPAELTGLGYLPEGTNLIAGVHFADLLADPGGQSLLQPPQPAWLQTILGNIEKWTGLKQGDLDHVVLGTTVGDKLPALALVVRTLKPYENAVLEKALAPAKAQNHRGKALYRFALKPLGEGLLWCPGEQTMVLLLRLDAAKLEDMLVIPLEPRPNLEFLTPQARKLLADGRIHKESLAWVAGHWQNSPTMKTLLAFVPLPQPEAEVLPKLQAVALNLIPDPKGWTILGYFQGPDEAALLALEKYLSAKQIPAAASYKVLPAGPDPENRWVMLQARLEADTLRRLGQGDP